jgi:hypothetical protein
LKELSIDLNNNVRTRDFKFISSYPELTTLTLNVPSYRFLAFDSGITNLTLPALTALICHTSECSLLDFLTTPVLSSLEVKIKPCRREPDEGIVARFLKRCTSILTSITIKSHPFDTCTSQVLPALSERPSVTNLALDGWPIDASLKICEPDRGAQNKQWCPNLEELTVSMQFGGTAQRARLESLAMFLKYGEGLGFRPLGQLSISREDREVEFPYKNFRDVGLVRLLVMLPLESD